MAGLLSTISSTENCSISCSSWSSVPFTGTPPIQRLALAGSSSTKTTGFMFQAAFARISRTSSWPKAPAP
ncbi:hypothetical protein D3C83_110540 [compost metagenome]